MFLALAQLPRLHFNYHSTHMFACAVPLAAAAIGHLLLTAPRLLEVDADWYPRSGFHPGEIIRKASRSISPAARTLTSSPALASPLAPSAATSVATASAAPASNASTTTASSPTTSFFLVARLGLVVLEGLIPGVEEHPNLRGDGRNVVGV